MKAFGANGTKKTFYAVQSFRVCVINIVAAVGRTHPLRCCAIRVLSSASCRCRNVMLFRYRHEAERRLCPRERIAKHLSERALTAGGYHGYGYNVRGD